MIKTINITNTAAKLRLLAKALEDGENIPDFSLSIVEDSPEGEPLFISAHRAEINVFGLIGLLQTQIQKITQETIEDE
jgi:hypothetical protein